MDTIRRLPGYPAETAGRSLPGGWQGRSQGLARRLVFRLVNVLIVMQKRLQDRDSLREMSDARLKDIGLGRVQVLRETDKPFWRA